MLLQKLEIPKIKYLCQSAEGYIWASVAKPYPAKDPTICLWLGALCIIGTGEPNPNWKDTLIDISESNYRVKDGILIRTSPRRIRRGAKAVLELSSQL